MTLRPCYWALVMLLAATLSGPDAAFADDWSVCRSQRKSCGAVDRSCDLTMDSKTDAIRNCTRLIAFVKSLPDPPMTLTSLWGLYRKRAYLYDRIDDRDNAIADYTQAIALWNSAPEKGSWSGDHLINGGLLKERAAVYVKMGKFDKAIGDYSGAIQIYETQFAMELKDGKETSSGFLILGTRLDRAGAFLKIQAYDRGIADYNRILELCGRSSTRCDGMYARDALTGRAQAYVDLGDYAAAIRDYDAVLAIRELDWSVARDVKATKAEVEKKLALSKPAVTGPTPTNVPPAATPIAAAGDCAKAATHWKSVEEINTLDVYEDHLTRFPNCEFAKFARARVEALRK